MQKEKKMGTGIKSILKKTVEYIFAVMVIVAVSFAATMIVKAVLHWWFY